MASGGLPARGGTRRGSDLRPLVVEDRVGFGTSLRARLAPLGVQADWVTHPDTANWGPDRWEARPLVLLDALDLSSQQDDRTRSRMASLDVLSTIRELPGSRRPTVLVYSTDMARPEVHLPLRAWGVVDGLFVLGSLVKGLPAIVRSGDRSGQVPPPTRQDWSRLHPKLAPGADVATIHQLMRRNERVWRQVWLADAPFDRAAMMWIRRNVLPLLGPGTGYRVAIDVTRKIAGLPYGRLA